MYGMLRSLLTGLLLAASAGSMPAQDPGYEGRAPDAPWRAAAQERITAHRMADLTVRVVDANGTPVPGAEVEIAMQKHAFAFGSAVTAHMLNREDTSGRRYREIVESSYNRVVFENDLKWRPWEIGASDRDDRYRRTWVAAALDTLSRWDVEVRGHYMLWGPLTGGSTPDDLTGDTVPDEEQPDALHRAWLNNIESRVPGVEQLGRIDEWDAINHPVGWGPTTVGDVLGADFYAEVMRTARRLAPDAELWINEGGPLRGSSAEAYARTVQALIEREAAPDGIGFMGHFRSSLPAPETLYMRLDRFARLIPRLQLTELDVDAEDEELQADYLRDVMITAFSHPSVEGTMLWGFWEGRHWRPDAALYRRDWSIKPAGCVWNELVFDRWWTDETGTTDDDGYVAARGFLGTYQLTARRGDRQVRRTIRLPHDGRTVQLVLR